MPDNPKKILKDVIGPVMETGSTSIAGAEFAQQRVQDLVAKEKNQNEFKPLMKTLSDYVDLVRNKLNFEGAWNGTEKEDMSIYAHMVEQMALMLLHLLSNLVGINVNFALNAGGDYLRSFSSAAGPLTPEQTKAVDAFMNALFARGGYAVKEGTIVPVDEQGRPQKDEFDQPVKASKERIEKMINDPERGLKKYLQDKGINVNAIQERAYPAEARKIQKAMEVIAERAVAKEEAAKKAEAPVQTGPQA